MPLKVDFAVILVPPKRAEVGIDNAIEQEVDRTTATCFKAAGMASTSAVVAAGRKGATALANTWTKVLVVTVGWLAVKTLVGVGDEEAGLHG